MERSFDEAQHRELLASKEIGVLDSFVKMFDKTLYLPLVQRYYLDFVHCSAKDHDTRLMLQAKCVVLEDMKKLLKDKRSVLAQEVKDIKKKI